MEISNKLRTIISNISQKYEESVAFEPHITLLPAIYEYPTAMIINKIKQLCSKINPFKIKLKSIEFGKNYYQCVYILVELTSELITANSICRHLFQKYDQNSYYPHLSLLYYDPDKINKTDIQKQINIDCKEQDINFIETEFIVDSVELWITIPDKNKISQWDMHQKFYFNKQTQNSIRQSLNMNNEDINQIDPDYFAKDWGKKKETQTPQIRQKEAEISNDNNGQLIIKLINDILLKI